MNKVHRKVEYALMALKHMIHKVPGELTTAKEIAETYQTPFDATARVMQVMAQKSWLKAEHGAFGGYQITRDLTKVSILDLIESILGPMEIAKCLQKKDDSCEIKTTCNIATPMSVLNQRLIDFYKSINIRELLDHGQALKSTRPSHKERVENGSRV